MALVFLASSSAFAPVRPAVPQSQAKCRVQMAAGPMYDAPLAPSGMGQEFINSERKPLSEYVGASVEFGDAPWDPWSLTELWKVSANNPDVAWLREAELKHGRLSMLAFAGILATNGGLHLPGEFWTDSDWTSALGLLPTISSLDQCLASRGSCLELCLSNPCMHARGLGHHESAALCLNFLCVQ